MIRLRPLLGQSDVEEVHPILDGHVVERGVTEHPLLDGLDIGKSLCINVSNVWERQHTCRNIRYFEILGLRCRWCCRNQRVREKLARKENLEMRGGAAAAHWARSHAHILFTFAAIS